MGRGLLAKGAPWLRRDCPAVSLMLGPLLVDLAREFDTSVAVTGQLAGATFIAWGRPLAALGF